MPMVTLRGAQEYLKVNKVVNHWGNPPSRPEISLTLKEAKEKGVVMYERMGEYRGAPFAIDADALLKYYKTIGYPQKSGRKPNKDGGEK